MHPVATASLFCSLYTLIRSVNWSLASFYSSEAWHQATSPDELTHFQTSTLRRRRYFGSRCYFILLLSQNITTSIFGYKTLDFNIITRSGFRVVKKNVEIYPRYLKLNCFLGLWCESACFWKGLKRLFCECKFSIVWKQFNLRNRILLVPNVSLKLMKQWLRIHFFL